MKVVSIPNGVFVENTYLVIDEGTGQCAVVDPGEDAELICRTLRDAGATAAAIWLTHAHLDHVLGVDRVREETGAPVYLHPADRSLYDATPQQGAASYSGRSAGWRYTGASVSSRIRDTPSR